MKKETKLKLWKKPKVYFLKNLKIDKFCDELTQINKI